MSTITYNKRDIQRILSDNGWIFHHQNGSHRIYRNDKNKHLSIPIGKCNKMLMQRLIKENSLRVN